MKIGFFDSGMGGLSVLHVALKALPNEQFIYYADEEHVPYGEKTKEEVIEYVDQAVRFMMSQNVKAIVIACNTATSAAIHILRKRYPIPIIGMEPAVKRAIDLYGDRRVLVAATPITVRGEKMKGLIERVDKEHLVDLVPLPRLVRFAESGEFESNEVIEYLEKEFEKYDFSEYSSIVLGCTHFNYFKDSFRKVLPEHINFVDGNEGTVNRLIYELQETGSLEQENQTVEFYYSGKEVIEENEFSRIKSYLERLDNMLYIK